MAGGSSQLISMFSVGSQSIFAHQDSTDVRRISTAERIAGYKQRCRELGLRHDAYGIPIVDGVRRPRRPRTETARTFDAAIRRAVTSPSTAILNRAERRREPVIDPTVPRSPVFDPAAAAQLEQVKALNLPESCLRCPRRRTFSDGRYALSWGYCEGCPSLTRRCPSCREDKPMENWGLGLVELTPLATKADWCCASCKHDVTHEMPPRFTITMVLTDIERHLLVSELSRAPGLSVDQLCVPLARMVSALRISNEIDIDISDCDQGQRDACSVVLSNVQAQISSTAREAAGKLYTSFVEQTWQRPKDEPRPSRPLSEFERSALAHGERPA